ncbi:MAG: hypothetical protein HY904_01335 [Deltaproteobacteria bacterium]|nr:hypothetical protein [Deltaproteobacteria bacterium]
MNVRIGVVLGWWGLAAACWGGGPSSVPVCRPWVDQLRQQGDALRVLAAATSPGGALGALLANAASLQHTVETGQGWQTTVVHPAAPASRRGALAADGGGWIALYSVDGLQVARSLDGASWSGTARAAAGLDVADVAHFREGTGPARVVFITRAPIALWLAEERPDGSWQVTSLALPPEAARHATTPARVAVAPGAVGGTWVSASVGASVYAGRWSAAGWAPVDVRAGASDDVMDLAGLVDGQGRAWLVYRSQAGDRARLHAMMLTSNAGPQAEMQLDAALVSADDSRLLVAGVDAAGRVRILHARAATELVLTVLDAPHVLRDAVALPVGARITSVQGTLQAGSLTLVETHSMENGQDQVLTHRCSDP